MNLHLWTAILVLTWIWAPSQAGTTRFVQLKRNSDGNQIAYRRYQLPQSDFPVRQRYLQGQVRAAPTTTTERPFVRVWNSFLRSVQPNFGFRNLTNPLVNLFNNGNANIIETIPVQAEVLSDDNQEEQYQAAPAASQTASKRKRKLRKQQKRKPVYESQEQDDTYDYYPPMYNPYYGASDYYGMRRLPHYNDYVLPPSYLEKYFQDHSVKDDDSEYTSDESRGKLNTKKYTLLRPLSLAYELDNAESSAEDSIDSSAPNENEYVVVGTNAEDSTPTETDAPNDDRATLSESVRNAFGNYMRDDLHNRQRQRQSERRASSAPAKVKPRQHQHFLLAARLVKNRQ